nr:22 kDa protein [Pineapple mealybug wilt-associated virus 2]
MSEEILKSADGMSCVYHCLTLIALGEKITTEGKVELLINRLWFTHLSDDGKMRHMYDVVDNILTFAQQHRIIIPQHTSVFLKYSVGNLINVDGYTSLLIALEEFLARSDELRELAVSEFGDGFGGFYPVSRVVELYEKHNSKISETGVRRLLEKKPLRDKDVRFFPKEPSERDLLSAFVCIITDELYTRNCRKK